MGFAFLYHALRPDARLHLADMRLVEEEHTDSALADSAAYRIRKLAVHKRLVEGLVDSFGAASDFELSDERFLIYSYAH